MRPLDTTPGAWEVYLGVIRSKSPAERFEMALRQSALVRALQEAGLRQRFPEASEEEIRRRAIRQRLGDELYGLVYGRVRAAAGEVL